MRGTPWRKSSPGKARKKSAATSYRTVIRLNPLSDGAYFHLGVYLQEKGDDVAELAKFEANVMEFVNMLDTTAKTDKINTMHEEEGGADEEW